MRNRFARLSTLCVVALLAGPALAGAARSHIHGLTIATTENPMQAGDAIVIYGQLKGSNNVGRTVVLYQHVDGARAHYTVLARTKTGAGGYYAFPRKAGAITTNRQWFALAPGRGAKNSSTVKESVLALVSLSQASANGTTTSPVTFTGNVFPNQAGRRVVLQQQASANKWTYLTAVKLGHASSYSLHYRWTTPGAYSVRVAFGHDQTDLGAESDTIPVLIDPTPAPSIATATLAVSGLHEVTHRDQFTGTAAGAGKAGDTVLLQHKGADGAFHDIATGLVRANGTYLIGWRYPAAGVQLFRVRILAGGQVLSAASSPVPVTVTLPATSTLPPGS